MRKVALCLGTSLQLLVVSIVGALLMVLRYVLRTPQPLANALPGESRLYKWMHGHIFYTVYGAVDAPSLVLLHAPAIGASSYEMRYLMEALGERYRVYALDLLGFGVSDHPVIEYCADLYVSLCRDFLNEVVKRPATVLASGLSCQYAIAVAAREPTVCERLVLLAPILLWRNRKRHVWFSYLTQNAVAGFVLYAFLTSRWILQGVVAQQYKHRHGHVPAEEFNTIFAAAHQFGAQHAPLALLAGKLALDVSYQLKTLAQPIQIMWGAQGEPDAQRTYQHQVPVQTQMVLIEHIDIHVDERHPQRRVAALVQLAIEAASVTSQDAVASDESVNDTAAVLITSESSDQETSKEETSFTSMEAYCVKCRQKRLMQNAQKTVTKNGRNAMEGTCPICGTRLFRFIGR